MQRHVALRDRWRDGSDARRKGLTPMDQRPWQPMLERSAGEAALEAAHAIAAALVAPSRADAAPRASLAGGDAGEALLLLHDSLLRTYSSKLARARLWSFRESV